MTSTSEATGMNYTDPEAVAAAVADTARETGSRDFLAAISERADLIEAAARLATADVLWANILDGRLQDAGLSVRARQDWRRTVKATQTAQAKRDREAARGFRVIGPDEAVPTIADLLPGAPVGPAIVPPAGYRVDLEAGIVDQTGENAATIAYRPLIISGTMVNRSTGGHRLRLHWWDRGAWHAHTVDRATALSAAELTKQADYGLPVNSGTARAMVGYLSAFEAVNGDILPRLSVSGHLGWQDGGGPSFLYGTRLLRPGVVEAAALDAESVAPTDWREDWIAYQAAGPGDRQLAGAFAPAGTLAGWQAAIAPLADYPNVAYAVYASLAAPLLEVLGAPSFFVDWSGNTSRGKTTTLMVGASVWGDPDPESPGSLTGTWNATPVAIERRAAMLNGIPAIIDDTKQARRPDDIARIIYQLAGGQGRARGDRGDGMREVSTWRTVGMVSGETPLTSFSQDGGTRGRVLPIWGDPFGPQTDETASAVLTLRNGIRRAYGHAGAAFVAHLLEHHDQWPAMREHYTATIDGYARRDPSNSVAARLAGYVAAIDLAADIAHQIGLMPWAHRCPTTPDLWAGFLAGASDADRPSEALRIAYGWAVAMVEHFDGKHRMDRDGTYIVPTSGALGRWYEADGFIAFQPTRLRGYLAELGFDVEGVLRTWADRGWLLTGAGGKTARPVRIGGHPTRCLCVPLRAFDAVGARGEEEGDQA